MILRDEILQQPEVAARFLARAPAIMEPLAAAILARGVDHVVIVGRGTSDHAAIYAQYVLGIRHGLSVGLGTPSVISLYGARPRLDRSLVIGISQSGASPDIVGVVAEGRRQGAPTVAITNDPTSPLALAAETVIDLGVGPERAIAATKTYTTELLAIAALSVALRSDAADAAADAADLAAIPDALASVASLEPEVIAMSADQAAASRLLILARGYEYATAREWSLKLKELSHVFADPYSAADFEHGPLALTEPGVPVIAMVRPGPTRDGLVTLLARMRADLSADLAIVSDDEEALRLARWPLRLPAGTPEWLGPIVSIVVGQLHALHLTRARGLDPEMPRHISKVTRTS
ncbi:MAG: SIS domain-containing protein [Candidatus Limnocylindrales bacterium]